MPRISQLPSLTTAAVDDELAIVDTSTATTKKVTPEDLAPAVVAGMAAGSLPGAKIEDGTVTADKIDFTTLKFGNYSTTEENTGFTYTDGKPIYKRTITGTATAAANTRSVITRSDLTGISKVIDASGYFDYNNLGHNTPFGATQTDATGGAIAKAASLFVTPTEVTVVTISDAARTSAPYSITMYYTKV